jgi:hypothetical protein
MMRRNDSNRGTVEESISGRGRGKEKDVEEWGGSKYVTFDIYAWKRVEETVGTWIYWRGWSCPKCSVHVYGMIILKLCILLLYTNSKTK